MMLYSSNQTLESIFPIGIDGARSNEKIQSIFHTMFLCVCVRRESSDVLANAFEFELCT